MGVVVTAVIAVTPCLLRDNADAATPRRDALLAILLVVADGVA